MTHAICSTEIVTSISYRMIYQLIENTNISGGLLKYSNMFDDISNSSTCANIVCCIKELVDIISTRIGIIDMTDITLILLHNLISCIKEYNQQYLTVYKLKCFMTMIYHCHLENTIVGTQSLNKAQDVFRVTLKRLINVLPTDNRQIVNTEQLINDISESLDYNVMCLHNGFRSSTISDFPVEQHQIQEINNYEQSMQHVNTLYPEQMLDNLICELF